MSSLKFPHATLGEPCSHAGAGIRELAALALRSASDALGRLAASLVVTPAATIEGHEPRLEFHCEAGAPEGALYLDGQLVARVIGVKRL